MVFDETPPSPRLDGSPQLILASKSPRRRELIAQIGLAAEVRSADVDETPASGEAPVDYVLRIARTKAWTVRRAIGTAAAARPVLAADTAVICDDRILGKPADAAEAARMLELLSGRTHRVLTGVALLGTAERTAVSSTRVWLRPVSAAEAAAYWASGEPQDKAGGYAVQGLGAVFVERLEGSWSGVVGLPLFETARLLAAEGLPVLIAG